MQIIGYGEDGLTAWALIHRLDLVRESLRSCFDERSDSSNWTIFFRPSVGRGKGGSIGEFDAIIATEKSVFLVESKWEDKTRLNKKNKPSLIEPEQILRHEIFEWIMQEWDNRNHRNWTEFRMHHGNDFSQRFHHRKLVQPGRRLSANLEFLLERVRGRRCKHVLLYFFSSDRCPYNSLAAKDGLAMRIEFKLVPIQYGVIASPSLFFEMSAR